MNLGNSKKSLIFVSTGRSGTRRIFEILNKHLPAETYAITHQMNISRISNILGNMMYYLGNMEWVKEIIFRYIQKIYIKNRNFITTDPLVAMMIPKSMVDSDNTCIIHIYRDKTGFSESFFRFTRKRTFSFIAHNFIPFWQIGIYPLENMFNKKIKIKYQKVWEKKNKWFRENYKTNKNYMELNMELIFRDNYLDNIIQKHFNRNINVKPDELNLKSNSSVK